MIPDFLTLPIMILWLLSPVEWTGGHATGMFTAGWVPHGAYTGMQACKEAAIWHAKAMSIKVVACRPYNAPLLEPLARPTR